jgi:anti-sigma regulatory factor (Ser/Thr protein kinase)
MKFHISNSAFIGNIDSFINAYDPTDPTHLKITTHDKWVSAHPVVLAMIAARGLTVNSGNVICDQVSARSGHYLERMKLFEMLNVRSGITISEHDPSGRFVPLTQIKSSSEQTHFITEMVPMLHLEPYHTEPIRYVVSELVRNVLEHSESKDGAIVAAQYHQKSNMIRIGIADTGVGIKKTINQSHKAWTDIDAIKLALIPGITGTTSREGGTSDNAGAGLFFIKSIASSNRNFFMIYSGDAMYKLLKRKPNARNVLYADPGRDNHSEKINLPYWQGTVVGIDISLETTGEFTALMGMINETYNSAMKERKTARHRKARFA